MRPYKTTNGDRDTAAAASRTLSGITPETQLLGAMSVACIEPSEP